MSVAVESIAWHFVEEDLPDADTTVLVYAPECIEPVWLGWYDGVVWFAVDASTFESKQVKAWADVPAGPPRRS